MINFEKTLLGIREMIMRDTWRDIDVDRPHYQRVLNDAITLLKEQENASKRNPVIVCPHCGKRVK